MSSLFSRLGNALLLALVRVACFAVVMGATYWLGLPGLMAAVVVTVVVTVLFRRRNARKSARNSAAAKENATRPEPLRWKPRFSLGGMFWGVVLSISGAALLQQFSVQLFNRPMLIAALVAGLLAGIVFPSIGWVFVVWRHNRKLRRHDSGSGGTPADVPLAHAAGSASSPPRGIMRVAVATGWGLMAVLLGSAAQAQLSGPCPVTINGTSLAGLDDSDVFVLTEGDMTLRYTVGQTDLIRSGGYRLNYAGFNVLSFSDAAERDDDAVQIDPRGVLDFGDLGDYSAGLYKFTYQFTQLDDVKCSGSFVFELPGDPLETVLGAGTVAVAAAGLAGLAGAVAGQGSSVMATLDASLDQPQSGEPRSSRTVTLEGDAAREALERFRASQGQGTVVELPDGEQWDLSVESDDSTIREGFVGSHGRITGIGTVIEDDAGNLTMSVDVEPLNLPPTLDEPVPADPVLDEPEPVPEPVPEPEVEPEVELPLTPAEPEVPPPPPDEPEASSPVSDETLPPVVPPVTAAGTAATPETPSPATTPSPAADLSQVRETLVGLIGETRVNGLASELGPMIDDFNRLASGEIDHITITQEQLQADWAKAKVPQLTGISLDPGAVSFNAKVSVMGVSMDVELTMEPTVTPDGRLNLNPSEIFGYEEKIVEVQELFNATLEQQNLRLTSVDVTPSGIQLHTAPA